MEELKKSIWERALRVKVGQGIKNLVIGTLTDTVNRWSHHWTLISGMSTSIGQYQYLNQYLIGFYYY